MRLGKQAGLLRGANGQFVAYGQLVPALGPSPRQHCPSIRSLHTDAKSMSLGALAIIGLKRTFGHDRSFFLTAGTRTGTPSRDTKK